MARSRENFFQSLTFTERVTSVAIWISQSTMQPRGAPPRGPGSRPERERDERRELRGDRARRMHPRAAHRVRSQVCGVVGLQSGPRRRRSAQEVVGEPDVRQAADHPVGGAVNSDRPGDPGSKKQRAGEFGRRHASSEDRRREPEDHPRQQQRVARPIPGPAGGPLPGTPPCRSCRSGPRSGRRAPGRASPSPRWARTPEPSDRSSHPRPPPRCDPGPDPDRAVHLTELQPSRLFPTVQSPTDALPSS